MAMSGLQETIRQQIASINAEIEAACQRAKRDPKTVKLIAVTKQRSVEEIMAVLAAGITELGENRVAETGAKMPLVIEQLANTGFTPTWHMIGHVQSRKAREVLELYSVVHSLDSLKLAQRYDQFAHEKETKIQVFLEMNVSGEDSKEGIAAKDWATDRVQRQQVWETVEAVASLPNLQVLGLMTMAPYYAEAQATRPVFEALRKLRDALVQDFKELALNELSMGMTNDYPVAIEEGATMIRVGRAIFGER